MYGSGVETIVISVGTIDDGLLVWLLFYVWYSFYKTFI